MSATIMMRRPVLVTLLGGWRFVVTLIPLATITYGLFMLIFFVRGAVLPIDDPALATAFHAGGATFLVAGLIGALLATRLHALRSCPFADDLPGLERRAALELLILGAVVFGLAAGAGPLVAHWGDRGGSADAVIVSSYFLPLMAALGYAVGVFNSDPREGFPRPWQVVPWVLAMTPVFFAPELAQITSGQPWLWLTGACVLAFVLLECTGTAANRRARTAPRPRGPMWLGDGWNVRDGSTRGQPATERASRRVAPPNFVGVRRTDWEWARATLHEIHGAHRGGWLGSVTAITVAVTVVAAALLVAHGAFAGQLATGGGITAGALSLDPLREPPALGRWVLITGFMAWMISIMVLGAPFSSPVSALQPISRRRRARVAFLMTQAQELSILGVGFALLLLGGAALSFHDGPERATSVLMVFSQWAGSVTAIVLLMPLARWARLRAVDARSHPAIRTELGLAGQVVAEGAVQLPLILGSVALVVVWVAARSLPPAGGTLVAILTVIAFFGLRWWWAVALDRFYARCDL